MKFIFETLKIILYSIEIKKKYILLNFKNIVFFKD